MNNLHIYNSLTKEKEKFEPNVEGSVGMYVCGPTVYSNVHIGNCRTFLSFDLVFRYLLHLGYKVRYVRNITDVGHLENDGESGEDPILKRARLEQLEPMEVAQLYTNDFRSVLKKSWKLAMRMKAMALFILMLSNSTNLTITENSADVV